VTAQGLSEVVLLIDFETTFLHSKQKYLHRAYCGGTPNSMKTMRAVPGTAIAENTLRNNGGANRVFRCGVTGQVDETGEFQLLNQDGTLGECK
jgi:hypothetical protein